MAISETILSPECNCISCVTVCNHHNDLCRCRQFRPHDVYIWTNMLSRKAPETTEVVLKIKKTVGLTEKLQRMKMGILCLWVVGFLCIQVHWIVMNCSAWSNSSKNHWLWSCKAAGMRRRKLPRHWWKGKCKLLIHQRHRQAWQTDNGPIAYTANPFANGRPRNHWQHAEPILFWDVAYFIFLLNIHVHVKITRFFIYLLNCSCFLLCMNIS